MKTFEYIEARTLDEAVAALQRPKARVIAGGTDLLGVLKDAILPEYPDVLVDLKMIPGLGGVEEDGGLLRIGALTRVADIASHRLVKDRYAALAQAAGHGRVPADPGDGNCRREYLPVSAVLVFPGGR